MGAPAASNLVLSAIAVDCVVPTVSGQEIRGFLPIDRIGVIAAESILNDGRGHSVRVCSREPTLNAVDPIDVPTLAWTACRRATPATDRSSLIQWNWRPRSCYRPRPGGWLGANSACGIRG